MSSYSNDPDFETSPGKEADEDPVTNTTDNTGNDWLTLRLRCELCKQRKVRLYQAHAIAVVV
jgi:hypothetical protein